VGWRKFTVHGTYEEMIIFYPTENPTWEKAREKKMYQWKFIFYEHLYFVPVTNKETSDDKTKNTNRSKKLTIRFIANRKHSNTAGDTCEIRVVVVVVDFFLKYLADKK